MNTENSTTWKLIQGGGNSFCQALKNSQNENKFTISRDSVFSESVEKFDGHRGGCIVFSTDVNSRKLDDNSLKNWAKQKLTTVKNRLFSSKMLDKIRKEFNVYAWTVGHSLHGVYTGEDGRTFDENSISLDIVGVTRDQLFKIAERVCGDFKQESVLIKDYETNQVYFGGIENEDIIDNIGRNHRHWSGWTLHGHVQQEWGNLP